MNPDTNSINAHIVNVLEEDLPAVSSRIILLTYTPYSPTLRLIKNTLRQTLEHLNNTHTKVKKKHYKTDQVILNKE